MKSLLALLLTISAPAFADQADMFFLEIAQGETICGGGMCSSSQMAPLPIWIQLVDGKGEYWLTRQFFDRSFSVDRWVEITKTADSCVIRQHVRWNLQQAEDVIASITCDEFEKVGADGLGSFKTIGNTDYTFSISIYKFGRR